MFPLLKERETASGGSRTSKRAASESIGRRNRRRISPADYGQDIQAVRHDRVPQAGHRQGRQRVRAHRQVAVGYGQGIQDDRDDRSAQAGHGQDMIEQLQQVMGKVE